MLTLAYPWLLLLLPLPWLIRHVLPPHQEPRVALRVPFLGRLSMMSRHEPDSTTPALGRRRLQWWLLAFAWVCVTFALSRPQWLEPPIIHEEPMRDMLLAVDLSGSMDTLDFTDSSGQTLDRLSAVKRVLHDFLARRDGDRVGLIFFGSAAFVQAPFTDDLEVVQSLLDEAQVRMLGPRTMLGDTIGLAINQFERSKVEERLLIVLTDGNDTGSQVPPERAAEIARDQGVTVHTVAIGDPAAAGEQALDEKTLAAVAEITGGGYYHANSLEEMEQIYTELDRLNPRKVETQSYRPKREVFWWALAAMMLTGMAGFGIAEWRQSRFLATRAQRQQQITHPEVKN